MPHGSEKWVSGKSFVRSTAVGDRKLIDPRIITSSTRPSFGTAQMDFRRFWIPPEWIGRGWSRCPCGWMGHRPGWKTHYAQSDHVKWWKSEMKKRVSLNAVYRHIIERLGRRRP